MADTREPVLCFVGVDVTHGVYPNFGIGAVMWCWCNVTISRGDTSLSFKAVTCLECIAMKPEVLA